jgi:hypothetical protein
VTAAPPLPARIASQRRASSLQVGPASPKGSLPAPAQLGCHTVRRFAASTLACSAHCWHPGLGGAQRQRWSTRADMHGLLPRSSPSAIDNRYAGPGG